MAMGLGSKVTLRKPSTPRGRLFLPAGCLVIRLSQEYFFCIHCRAERPKIGRRVPAGTKVSGAATVPHIGIYVRKLHLGAAYMYGLSRTRESEPRARTGLSLTRCSGWRFHIGRANI